MKAIFTLLISLFVTIGMNGQLKCHQPANLSVTDVTATSAKLHWLNSGVGYVIKDYMVKYVVEYGVKGFVIGKGEIIKTPTLDIMITGLGPNTSYDFYVKKICYITFEGGYIFEVYSAVAGPFTFTTTTLGIEEFNLSSVTLFPNPTNGLIEFKSQENIEEIEIFSLTGQKLCEKKNKESNLNIDLSDFNSGLYLVKVYTDMGTGVYKVVKD